MQHLRRLSVLTLSTLLVLGLVHYGTEILTLLITPLPKNLQSCIKDKISTEVNAQAICTGTVDNTFSVWTQSGKLQDSNIFYTSTLPSGTLTDFTQDTTKAGIRIQTSYSSGTYTPGIFWSTDNNNSTPIMKPKAGIWLFQDNNGSDMILGTSNAFATGITNTGLTINQDGNIVIGGTTGLADSRLAITSTNGDNDAQISMRRGSETMLSLLAWDGSTHISSGVYYTNGAWTHANKTGNNAASMFRITPGTGVEWFAYNDGNPATWNVANAKLLWSDAGVWNQPVRATKAGPDMTTTGMGQIEINNAGTGPSYITFHRTGVYAGNFGLDTDNWLTTKGWSAGAGYTSLRTGSLQAMSRIYAQENIEFPSQGLGLYSAQNSGARFMVSNVLGSWRVQGQVGGWYGLSFDTAAGQVNFLLGQTTQTTQATQRIGFYNSTTTQWNWYSIGQDLYANRFYDANNATYYADPASTSVMNVIQTAQVNGIGASVIQLSNGQTNGVRIGNGTTANLAVTGSVTASNISDMRLKTNIAPLENGLQLVDKIKPVTFEWKDPSQYTEIEGEDADRTYFGFIAQELEEVFPQWIMTNANGWKVMRDSAYVRNEMFSILFKAVQELNAKVQEIAGTVGRLQAGEASQEELLQKQQQLIEAQEKRITELEKKIDKLEKN